MIQQVGNAFITMMVAKFMLNDLPHAIGLKSNPGNPNTGDTTLAIISRAGLKEYEERWWPPTERGRPAKPKAYVRTRNVGVYSVVMTRTDGACAVKLYENLEGWRRVLRATWTGSEKTECNRKFEEVVEAIVQVRFEEKMKIRGLKA